MSAGPSRRDEASTSGSGSSSTNSNRKRSSDNLVGRASFEERFLKCPNCQELFNQESKKPTILPCFHTICLECLLQLFPNSETRRSEREFVKCRTCGKGILLSEEEVKELPSLLNFTPNLESTKPKNVCSAHHIVQNFYCRKCSVPVCGDCAVTNHKETQQHVIVDFNTVLEEEIRKSEKIKTKCEEMSTKSEDKRQMILGAFDILQTNENHLMTEVNDKFDEIIAALKQRQEEITDKISKSIKEERNNHNMTCAAILQEKELLEGNARDLDEAKSSKDIRQIQCVTKNMEDYVSEMQMLQTQIDSKVIRTAELSLDLKELLPIVRNIGSVEMKVVM